MEEGQSKAEYALEFLLESIDRRASFVWHLLIDLRKREENFVAKTTKRKEPSHIVLPEGKHGNEVRPLQKNSNSDVFSFVKDAYPHTHPCCMAILMKPSLSTRIRTTISNAEKDREKMDRPSL